MAITNNRRLALEEDMYEDAGSEPTLTPAGPSNQFIIQILLDNPNATDAQLVKLMDDNGITPADMARATGSDLTAITNRYNAAKKPVTTTAPVTAPTVTAPVVTTPPATTTTTTVAPATPPVTTPVTPVTPPVTTPVTTTASVTTVASEPADTNTPSDINTVWYRHAPRSLWFKNISICFITRSYFISASIKC